MKPFPLLLLSLALCSACSKQKESGEAPDFPQLVEKGEITAVTLYSSTSYFLYRMEPMGYEYELMNDFARANGLKLTMKVAESLPRLVEMLSLGEADVAAYPVVLSNELKEGYLSCGREEPVYQVVVQPVKPGAKILADVTELIGKEVYVKSGTPFHDRLVRLDKELGGGIIIQALEEDIISEELVERVANGEIPYTITDDKTARLNKTYYRNIDINLPISFRQRSSWIVDKRRPLLAGAINEWAQDKVSARSYKATAKRYFELSKKMQDYSAHSIRNGRISPYDSLFRKYAKALDWDWMLLASLSWQESHFIDSVESWAGACGLMGIMPRTAAALDIPLPELADPETNIRAGTEVLRRFKAGFREVGDSLQRIKFTLAAYNAGIGHVQDACRLAGKHGKSPTVWDDNVAGFILLKREPAYYNDPACKFGYLRGAETFLYVKEILDRYEFYKKAMKE
ncbi:lytic transglycosylase F [Bacteroidia bacterium]|nr:lytic transglycosylase F [Bacteroidia bacterium]